MLRMKPEDLPLEVARLGYALKTISGEAIMNCSPRAATDPVNFDAVAHALGMRARALRSDYVEPTLALMGCNSDGFPRADRVHELYIGTRRSGDDEVVGPLVSRWLRLTFTGDEPVYILPISAGTIKREFGTWVFFTEHDPRIVVVTFNPVKYARVYARANGLMRDYAFEWTKSIPGHYQCFAQKGAEAKSAFVSMEAIQGIVPGLSDRVVDCLTGVSSTDETRIPVKTSELASVLRQVREALLSHPEFSALGEGFKKVSDGNMFKSALVEFFTAAGAYPAEVQHEIMADMGDSKAKLAGLNPKDAVDFLRSVSAKAMHSHEIADALATNLINNINSL